MGIEHDVGAPKQQRVEEFARAAAPAAAARGHRLAAVMPAADDLALRGGRFHAPGTRPDHRGQQVPGVVGAQCEQAFIDGRKGHFGASRRLAAMADLDVGNGGLPDRVLRPVGRDLDLEFVRRRADLERGDADLEGRLGEIDHCRRHLVLAALVPEAAGPVQRLAPAPVEERVPAHIADAPAHRQHAHIDIRGPGRVDLDFDRRVVAAQALHPRLDHARTLDRDQRGRFAEGHTHLQARGFARFVALFLGQHIDAVVVALGKPELALPGDPDAGRCRGGVAGSVRRLGNQLDLAGGVELCIAQQQSAVVGRAAAQGPEIACFGAVVVGIEAAHDAFAGADDLRQPALHRHGLALERPAPGVEREDAEGNLAALAGPGTGLDTQHHRAGPQRQGLADGLHLAVGVVESDFGQQLARPLDFRQAAEQQPRGAGFVGGKRLLVGHQPALTLRRAVGLVGFFFHLGVRAGRPRRLEAELLVAGKPGAARPEHRGRPQRRAGHRPAGEVVHLHGQRHLLRRHLHALGRDDARIDQRQAEFLDAEIAAGPGAGEVALPIAGDELLRAHRHRAVEPELRGRRHDPARCRAAAAAPGERQGEFLAAALVDDLQLGRHGLGRQRRQALQGFQPGKVLHRDGFAGAQQRAVEDRVDSQPRLGLDGGRQVEAPGLDALLPA